MFKLTKKLDFFILSVFGLIFVFVIGYAFWLNSTDPVAVASHSKTDLSTALEESGADFVTLSAQCWEEIDNRFHDGDDLAQYYEDIKVILGDDDLLSFDEYDDEGYAGFSVSGITEQGYTLNLVVQSLGQRNTEDETYIIAEITDDRETAEIDDVRQYLEKIFATVSCDCEPSFMLEGKYEEILSSREKKKKAKSILALMDAKIEEKVADKDYVSYSGYTKEIPYSVTSFDHVINLQVALSDNEEEGNTHIYIGTPVVFSDF